MSLTFNKQNVTQVITDALNAVAFSEKADEGYLDQKDSEHVDMVNEFISQCVAAVMTLKPKAQSVARKKATSGSGGDKVKRTSNSYAQFYSEVARTMKNNGTCDLELSYHDNVSNTKSEKTREFFDYINKEDVKPKFEAFTGNLKELLDFLGANLPSEVKLMHKTSVAWTLFLTEEQRNSFKVVATTED